MRSDFPRTIQQTFIIYSRLDRDGNDELIIPSVPGVRQSASFTSETGFAAAAGAYESAAVDITPVLIDGALSFEVLGKQQGVYHSGAFELTLTTNGDAEAEIEPASATFTINVIIFGKADLLGFGRTMTCYVRDYIEPFSIAPPAINPVIDYGGSTGALKDVTQQYDSGLYLTHVQDMIQQKTVDIKLGGIAARPGVYLAWVFTNQWTEGGQYDNLPSTFDRGNNAVPFVVTILDHDHAEGNLMVSAKATVGPALHYRVVMLTATVEAFASAEYLYNCEMTQASESLWGGSYSDDKGEYTITYEYQLRLDGDTWKLEGREIDSRSEDPPPAFDLYDASAKRLPEQDVPHVNGWSNVGIQGLTEFALRAREFPDDPWELFGFFNHLAPSVWEQQPMYCPQFEGLVTAPAVQFDGGYIYSEDAEITNDFEGFQVKKEVIAHVVTPYAPPASEKYTYTTIPTEGDPETITRPVRDVAVRIGNVPHSLAGDRPGNVGVPGGDPWGYWAGARRIAPKNGTSGDYADSNFAVKCHYDHETISTVRNTGHIDEPGEDSATNTDNHAKLSWDAELNSFDGQSRSADEIILAVGAAINSQEMNYFVDNRTEYEYSNPSNPSAASTTITTATVDIDEINSSYGFAMAYLASGPFTGLCKHEALCTGIASAHITGTAISHQKKVVNQGDDETTIYDTTENIAINPGANFVSGTFLKLSGYSIKIGEYEKVTTSKTASIKMGYGYSSYYGDTATGLHTLSLTHSAITENINGFIIENGTTHIVENIDGVVTDSTVDDPDGSAYESSLSSFDPLIIPPPPESENPWMLSNYSENVQTSDVETIRFGS